MSKLDDMAKRIDKLQKENKIINRKYRKQEEKYLKDKIQTNVKWQKFIQIYIVSLVVLKYDYSNYEIEFKDGVAELKLSRSE